MSPTSTDIRGRRHRSRRHLSLRVASLYRRLAGRGALGPLPPPVRTHRSRLEDRGARPDGGRDGQLPPLDDAPDRPALSLRLARGPDSGVLCAKRVASEDARPRSAALPMKARFRGPLLAQTSVGHKLGSGATHGEGAKNILCGYLAVAALSRLLENTLLGRWWLDPIAALAIARIVVREGLESWRGESCGCATC
jgi:hypothetical protein